MKSQSGSSAFVEVQRPDASSPKYSFMTDVKTKCGKNITLWLSQNGYKYTSGKLVSRNLPSRTATVKLKKGRNVLEVTVANLLVNQVGDDAIRDRVLRDFKPNGKYDRFQRPFDRLNHESGLFGPVTLQSGVSCLQK